MGGRGLAIAYPDVLIISVRNNESPRLPDFLIQRAPLSACPQPRFLGITCPGKIRLSHAREMEGFNLSGDEKRIQEVPGAVDAAV